MAAFERKRASYADLEAVPETMVGEILDGELVTSPRPGMLHANASSELGAVLRGRFRKGSSGPGGWIILDEPELHLHGDALVPDLAGWRRERMPEVPDVAASELAPDWVCEVVSPSTERRDRSQKLRIYAREGVGHVWLVNPALQTLEVYRREAAGWVLLAVHEGDAAVRAEPFDAAELALGDLWAR